MTIHQAAAFHVPLGEHRGRILACVALDAPHYLERLAEGKAAECRPGTAFHVAVCVVVEQLRRNTEADISEGRTVSAEDARASAALAATHNAAVLARDAAEQERKWAGSGKGKKGATPTATSTAKSGAASGAGALFTT